MKRRKWLAAAGALAVVLGLAACTSERQRPDDGPIAHAREADSPRIAVRVAELVSQLTGPGSPAGLNQEWNIVGTDLGFSFEHRGRTYMVFGDTWGRAGVEAADWRSNIMAIVEPHPEHGYILADVIKDANGQAKELLSSLKQPGEEYTVMPTAGISVGDRMYLHYMSIRDWEREWWGYKHPEVNGAGLAYSDDHGQTWVKDKTTYWPGDTAFTQAAMVHDGDYVYVFGTPAGRFGPLRLLRAPGAHLLEPERYEYWTGSGWTSDVNIDGIGAAEVVPAPVGELSVRWSPHLQRWLMMYTNEVTHAVVLRTAERLEGPWDEERVVVTADHYPSLYAPFMLPVNGPEVFFTMSIFEGFYNVLLMRLTLEQPPVIPP